MSSSTAACICAYTSLSLLVLSIPLLIIYTVDSDPQGLEFTVQRVHVKPFDLTHENRLFCIFGFSIRVHNGDPKHSKKYNWMEVEVRKGKHHKLAWDVVKPFDQAAGNVTVLEVEAIALYDPLERGFGEELRKEKEVGATTVDIFFFGVLGRSDTIHVICEDVKVYFDGLASSMGKFERVMCNVRVFSSSHRN